MKNSTGREGVTPEFLRRVSSLIDANEATRRELAARIDDEWQTCIECGTEITINDELYVGLAPHGTDIFGGTIVSDAPWCARCGQDTTSACGHAVEWRQRKTCPICARVVVFRHYNPNRDGTCSPRCARALEAQRKREARAEAREWRERTRCQVCSEWCSARSDARYCSSACRQKAYRARKAAD